MFARLKHKKMKKNLIALLLLTCITSVGIAQRGARLFTESTISESNGDFKIFSTLNHAYVHEINEKSGQKVQKFYVFDLRGSKPTKVDFKSISIKNPELFSPHVIKDVFGIFESYYDVKEKTRYIYLHNISTGGVVSSRVIHKFKDETPDNPEMEFVHSPYLRFAAIYIFRRNSVNGAATGDILSLNSKLELSAARQIKFEERIALNSKFKILISDKNTFVVIHAAKDKENRDTHFMYSLQLSAENAELQKNPIVVNNTSNLFTYRAFVDEKSQIQLYGFFKDRDPKKPLNFVSQTINMESAKNISELKILHDPFESDIFDGIMSTAESTTIIAFTSSFVSGDTPPAIKFVCINEKGEKVWENRIVSTIDSRVVEKFQINEAGRNFKYWMHNNNLYCLYNVLENSTKPAPTVSAANISKNAITSMVRVYNLKDGKYIERPLTISGQEKYENSSVLVKSSDFSSQKFGISFLNIGKGNYLMMQIMP
jgi:uncharacterized protein YceH (UPF0502 family)